METPHVPEGDIVDFKPRPAIDTDASVSILMLSMLKGIEISISGPRPVAFCFRIKRNLTKVPRFAHWELKCRHVICSVTFSDSNLIQVQAETGSRSEQNKEVARLTQKLVKGNSTAYRSLQIYTSRFR